MTRSYCGHKQTHLQVLKVEIRRPYDRASTSIWTRKGCALNYGNPPAIVRASKKITAPTRPLAFELLAGRTWRSQANLKLISRARFTWENRAQYGMQAFTCNGARSAIQWSSKDMGLEKFQEWTLVEFLPRGRCSAVMELLYLSASPATV